MDTKYRMTSEEVEDTVIASMMASILIPSTIVLGALCVVLSYLV